MLMKLLESGRHALGEELVDSENRWRFSPEEYLHRTALVPILRQQVRGRVLDVGCGTMPYRPYLDQQAIETYDGFDIEKRSPDTKFLGDAQNMSEIESGSYDTVMSLYSLEHVARPWEALGEIVRVCKPGGAIVLAVPHLSRLHEEPHDYFRFTDHGLRALANGHDLEVTDLIKLGGVATFLGHQVATILVSAVWNVPILKWLVFWLNYALVVRPCVSIDRLTGASKKMPQNVVAVLRNPDDGSEV